MTGAATMGRAFLQTFRTIFSDRTAFLLLFASTILYSFFYPSAYSGEVPVRMPVAVVDLDNSGTSRSLIMRLDAVQQAELTARAASMGEARDLIERQAVSAVVVIPEGFERRILAGGQGQLQLYGNGAYLLRTSTALSGVGAAVGALGREAAIDQAMAQGAPAPAPLALAQRPLFNATEGYGATILPGVSFVIIHQTLLIGLALLAATLREREGSRRFPPHTLMGIALAFFVIGGFGVSYFTGFVFWFHDYPRAAGSPLALVVGGSLFIAATVAGALALAGFFRTRERPLQLWIVTSLVIFFLSGLSWPAEATPGWLAAIARLLPTTPGIHLMVGLNQMGASLSEQRWELLNLAGLTLLYGTIAWFRLVERTRAGEPALSDCGR